MLKINVSPLYYSRTFYTDYRWIYLDSRLCQESVAGIDNDFSHMDRNKNLFLGRPHLFVRRHLDGAVSFYKYSLAGEDDSGGRRIFSLSGYTFFPHDSGSKSLELLSLISSYLFNNNINFDRTKIKDKSAGIHLSEEMELSNLEKYVFEKPRYDVDKFLISEYFVDGFLISIDEFQRYNISKLPPQPVAEIDGGNGKRR
ncbi:MAG: hypothetical protein FWE22_03310 [Firmicutes bacterium]|nr:hypothetical protein [Bacillota bacterium]